MAYTVNNYNGTFLTTVPDGTIDATTDIRFVGKNYAGYGEIQNENFLHLMENFANTTAPGRAVVGQIWYDSTSTEKRLKFWDGSNWKVAGGAKVQSNPPSGLSAGEFWWDSSTKQLYAYSGTEYVLVGPEASPDAGASAVTSRVVKDEFGNPKTVVVIESNDVPVAIVSGYDTFKLGSETSIPGFLGNSTSENYEIKKGITLAYTSADTGISENDYVFWGTTSNALTVGGITPEQIQGLLEGSFTQAVDFKNAGYRLGDDQQLRVFIENNSNVIFQQQYGGPVTFRIGTTSDDNIVLINQDSVVPGKTGTISLGKSNLKWTNVFSQTLTADSIVGPLTGNTTGVHKGNVTAANDVVMVNSLTNVIGTPDGTTQFRGQFGTPGDASTEFYGTFRGTIIGDAPSVAGYVPSEQVPSTGTKVTIPVRDTNGDIFARNFVASGSVNKADRLAFDSGFYTASATIPGTSDKRSIAARDAAGDIYATLFRGTATAARYADLAEKYLADKDYEVGTVMTVGGEAEVRASVFGDLAIGVVSANPAFMMNEGLEGGTYVALKGRVPVKVVGSIRKGDRLVASDNGCAIHASFHQYSDVFAVALETSDDTGVKLIEAIIL